MSAHWRALMPEYICRLCGPSDSGPGHNPDDAEDCHPCDCPCHEHEPPDPEFVVKENVDA